MYERLYDGKLRPSSMAAAAARFSLHRNTIGLIWSRRPNLDGKKGRMGRKKKYVVADDKKAMEAIEPRLRQSIRATAAEIGMPKSSLADLLQNDEIRHVSTHIHPQLSNINKIRRLDFVFKFVNPGMCFFDWCYMIMILTLWLSVRATTVFPRFLCLCTYR